MKRTPLKRFTPLRAKTRLKAKTPLKRQTRLKPQSDKAKLEYKAWLNVKRERVNLLVKKFGHLLCEFCKKPITYGQVYDGHHNQHRSLGGKSELQNARILHRPCHSRVHDQNLSVESLLGD